MPSGIYGSRSIIPNNYYFTFDRIYQNENEVNILGNSDNILIGRCVLAREERTVWLKTTNGYIQVAKLDNEARFKYSEGFALEAENCIDDILSYGNTPHGNGTYIVNFDEVSKRVSSITNNEPAWDNNIWQSPYNQYLDKQTNYNNYSGTWPNIQGLTQKQYLPNSTFLLYQYTEPIQPNDDEYIGFKYGSTDTDNERLKKIWNNKERIYIQENDTYKKLTGDYNTISLLVKNEDITNLVDNKSETFYILQGKKYNVYQILTDITQENSKQDIKEINHFNKTFIRKGVITYSQANGNLQNKWGIDNQNIKRTVYYIFDTSLCDFIEQPSVPIGNNSANYYTRIIKWNENSWEDTSEQYTGYIGELDPYTEGNSLVEGYELAKGPFNQYTQYYNSNKQSVGISKIDYENTLIEKSNTYYVNNNGRYQLAQGPFNKTTEYFVEGNTNPQLITASEYEASLDVCSNTYYIKRNSNRQNLDSVQDLTTAINKLDEIIGSKTRFTPDSSGIVNTISQGSLSSSLTSDTRKYNIPEDNIFDTLIHHDADIGFIEDISSSDGNTYNLDFVKTGEYSEGTQSDPVTGSASINSLTEAITKLDHILGSQNRLGKNNSKVSEPNSNWNVTGANASIDMRQYNISETNVIDAIVKLAADIGQLSSQDPQYNFDYIKTSSNHTDNKLWSLSEAIKFINDNLIGNRNDLQGQNNNLSNDKTLFNNLETLNEKIGDISSLNGNNVKNQNTNTLTEKIKAINDSIGIISNFYGDNIGNLATEDLITKLAKLNSAIGNISSLNGNNANSGNNQTLIEKIQAINNLIGNISNFTGENLGSSTDLTNKLITLNDKIGKIQSLVYKNSSNTEDISIEGTTLIDKINNVINLIGLRQGQQPFQEQLDNYIKLINNLAENVDYLEILISQLQESGGTGTSSGSSALMWQTL